MSEVHHHVHLEVNDQILKAIEEQGVLLLSINHRLNALVDAITALTELLRGEEDADPEDDHPALTLDGDDAGQPRPPGLDMG